MNTKDQQDQDKTRGIQKTYSSKAILQQVLTLVKATYSVTADLSNAKTEMEIHMVKTFKPYITH